MPTVAEYESLINDPEYLIRKIHDGWGHWKDGEKLELEALRKALRAAHREMDFRQREHVARAILEED